MTESHVIVVGAGPVGMTVAALLAAYGIQVTVLEKSPSVCPHPRAQTIDDESLRTLQSIGITDKLRPTLLTASGSRYYDSSGACFAEVGPGPENFGFPKRNYMLQQNLDELLLELLQSSPLVHLRFSTTVTSVQQDAAGVIATTASNEIFHAQYLLACDGGQSPIRNRLGIEMQGETYPQDWIVLDATDDPDTATVSHFFCNPERPHVSIASPNKGRRYEWMLRAGETAEDVLTDDFLAQLLTPFRTFDPTKITRRAVYTFHARIAERLREQRILLLGDAAHLSPPFAGQGMNAGIRDAHNVAWKVAGVVRHGWDNAILDSYDQERRGPIWAMIQLAVAMGEFVMPMGAKQAALTQSLMAALERFPEARDWLFQMKFKPKPRYTGGVFIDLERQPYEASLVGEMAPQPKMQQLDGSYCKFDDLIGNGFALVAQDDASEEALCSLQGDLWPNLAPTKLRVYNDLLQAQQASTTNTLARVAWAKDGYERPLRTHRDQVLLIRPDRYVMGAFNPQELNTSFLDKITSALAPRH